MTERRWERIGASMGVAFVLLTVVGTVLYPAQPRVDSPAATTAAWVHDNRAGLATGMILGLVAAAALVWFSAHLRHVLDRAESGAEALSPVVFGAGIAVASAAAISVLPSALLVFMDGQPGGLRDAAVVRMLGDLNNVLYGPVTAMGALFLVALGVAMLRGEMVTRWLGWAALVSAALNLAALPVAMTFSTYHGAAWLALGWSGFVSAMVVVLAVSAEMLWQPEHERHPVHRPTFVSA